MKSEGVNNDTKDWLCSERSGDEALPRCSDKLLLADDSEGMSDLLRKSELDSPACLTLGSFVAIGGTRPQRKRAISYHSSPERWHSQGDEPRSSNFMRRSLGADIEHVNLSKVSTREKQIVISVLDPSESNKTCGNEGKRQVSDLFSVANTSAINSKKAGESVSA